MVLGANTHFKRISDNICLVGRIQQGTLLYKRGYAGKLLFSGGRIGSDVLDEGVSMEKLAQSYDIPQNAMLNEDKATSTYENFLFAVPIMKENNIRSIIIVTDPYHSFRASLVASKLHIFYHVAPAT